jgi:hypothetical protein
MSTGGGGGEIRTKLGLDVEAFKRGISEAREGVRQLQTEMRRGRASEMADEQRAQQRLQRARQQAHQQESRQHAERSRYIKQYEADLGQLTDLFGNRFVGALKKVSLEQDRATSTAREFLSAAADASMTLLGMEQAGQVVGTIGAAFEQAATRAEGATQAAKEYFASLRGEASLKGEPGVTSSILSSNLLTRFRTGMTGDEASAFVQMFEGSLPAGMQKNNITREVADEFAVAAAEMLTRQGADPETRGDLAGMVANFQRVGSAGEGLAALEAVRVGLTEGRGYDKPLTDALLQVAGQFVSDAGTGMVPTLPELSAMIGVTSLSAGAGAAGTRVEQLVRMLQGSTTEQMDFLKAWGVTSDMNVLERLDVIAPKMAMIDEHIARKGPGKGAGGAMQEILSESGFAFEGWDEEKWADLTEKINPTDNAYEMLVAAGFSAEGLKALQEIIPAFGTLKQRIAKAQQPAAPGQVEQLNRQFFDSDLGRALRAEQFKLAAEQISGAQTMPVDTVLQLAQTRSLLDGEHLDWRTGIGDRVRSAMYGGQVSGERLRHSNRAIGMLRSQIADAGLFGELKQEFPDMALGYQLGEDPRQTIGRLVGFLEDRGQVPLEAEFAKMEVLAKGLDRNANLTDEQVATLRELKVSIDTLRDRMDRTFAPGVAPRGPGPVQAPQAPPPGWDR